MTDEEMAEEYASSSTSDRGYYYEGLKEGFLDGLKASKPRWHDLRKDPNDLPNDDRVVSEQKGENVRYVKFRNKWFYLDRTAEANVIAWCEIPKYMEE